MQVLPFTGLILALLKSLVLIAYYNIEKNKCLAVRLSVIPCLLYIQLNSFSPPKGHDFKQTACLQWSFVSAVTCPVQDQNPVGHLSPNWGMCSPGSAQDDPLEYVKETVFIFYLNKSKKGIKLHQYLL